MPNASSFLAYQRGYRCDDLAAHLEAIGAIPPRLTLRATATGSLTVEKSGPSMQLVLHSPAADPQLSARLTEWTAESETSLRRNEDPDSVEAAILDLAVVVRDLP